MVQRSGQMFQLDLPACHFPAFLLPHLSFELPNVKVRPITLVDTRAGGGGSVHVVGEVSIGDKFSGAWAHKLFSKACVVM